MYHSPCMFASTLLSSQSNKYGHVRLVFSFLLQSFESSMCFCRSSCTYLLLLSREGGGLYTISWIFESYIPTWSFEKEHRVKHVCYCFYYLLYWQYLYAYRVFWYHYCQLFYFILFSIDLYITHDAVRYHIETRLSWG